MSDLSGICHNEGEGVEKHSPVVAVLFIRSLGFIRRASSHIAFQLQFICENRGKKLRCELFLIVLNCLGHDYRQIVLQVTFILGCVLYSLL